MSRQNSDLDLFGPEETGGLSAIPPAAAPGQQSVSANRPKGPVGKRQFDVYSFSLILAFILFVAAAILLFINSGKY
ncbi:MAG: hypothetical protein ABL888_13930 [Pirellulaceae bacterium]